MSDEVRVAGVTAASEKLANVSPEARGGGWGGEATSVTPRLGQFGKCQMSNDQFGRLVCQAAGSAPKPR